MWDAHHRTDLELAAAARSLERRVRACLLEGFDAGHASLERFLLGSHRGGVAIRLGRGRYGAIRELVGALLKHTGRRPRRVSKDRPTLGSYRVLPDLRRTKRRRVKPARMAVAAAHDGWAISRDSVEIGRGRPSAPAVLVEPAPGEPPSVADVARAAPDLLERLLDRLRPAEIELRHLKAPPHEVHVRVEPAGSHEPAAQIDPLGPTGVAREVGRAPDRGNAAVAREQR